MSQSNADHARDIECDVAGAELQVDLVWSPGPRQVVQTRLTLPAGSTVAQALDAWRASMQDQQGPKLDGARSLGIWGRPVSLDQVLNDRDRIEIYRALKADPKESRRVRYQAHVARWGKRKPICTPTE